MPVDRIDVDEPLENADWPKRTPDTLKALGVIKLAFDPTLHPRDPGGEAGGEFIRKGTTAINEALRTVVNGWSSGQPPWQRRKQDFVDGAVPGFEYGGARRGVAGRMEPGSARITLYDGAFTDGGDRPPSNLIYHEVGHNLAVHLLNHQGGIGPQNPAAMDALAPWRKPGDRLAFNNPWTNPYGDSPSYSDNAEEIVAEAYSQLIHGGLESETVYRPGIHGPEGAGFTPGEIANQQRWRDLYAWIAQGARDMGLPDHRLWALRYDENGNVETIPAIPEGDLPPEPAKG